MNRLHRRLIFAVSLIVASFAVASGAIAAQLYPPSPPGGGSVLVNGATISNPNLINSDANVDVVVCTALNTPHADCPGAGIIVVVPGASPPSFADVTTGTSTVALSIGTGGSLAATGTGTIVATSATGNAGTATALAGEPSPCAAGQYVSDISAAGVLTCAAVTAATVPVTPVGGIVATDAQAAIAELDTDKAETTDVAAYTSGSGPAVDGTTPCSTPGDLYRDSSPVDPDPDVLHLCKVAGTGAPPNGSQWTLLSDPRTIVIPLYETAWISGDCIGFAGADAFEACDQPGTEIPLPTDMILLSLSVIHRGVTRGSTDICQIDVLEKAPGTTTAGTSRGSVIYGDATSNDPGEVQTATTLTEAIAAGGSIQFKISNYATNTCTTLNGALVLRVRNG